MQTPAYQFRHLTFTSLALDPVTRQYGPTERPTGKYCVATEAISAGLCRCIVWRNDVVLATGRGASLDDAWREAHRSVRMARHCGL